MGTELLHQPSESFSYLSGICWVILMMTVTHGGESELFPASAAVSCGDMRVCTESNDKGTENKVIRRGILKHFLRTNNFCVSPNKSV